MSSTKSTLTEGASAKSDLPATLMEGASAKSDLPATLTEGASAKTGKAVLVAGPLIISVASGTTAPSGILLLLHHYHQVLKALHPTQLKFLYLFRQIAALPPLHH